MSRLMLVLVLVSCAVAAVMAAPGGGGKVTIDVGETRGGGVIAQSGTAKVDWPISKDGNIRGGFYGTHEREKFGGGGWNRHSHGGLSISGRW